MVGELNGRLVEAELMDKFHKPYRPQIWRNFSQPSLKLGRTCRGTILTSVTGGRLRRCDPGESVLATRALELARPLWPFGICAARLVYFSPRKLRVLARPA